MSNSIESIHSTRRQIEEALSAADGPSAKLKRFREFARLYIDLSYSDFVIPQTPEDIRRIYDQVMAGEPMENPPDGRLFRRESVVVTDGQREIHAGLVPEETIVDAMEKMLDLTSSCEVPELYSALASHYIFEYVHPFYDGNGRTGRYLLSLFLEAPLSKPTALSLSRVMAENKAQYYQAFQNVEDPLNHGEATFFVMAMHELILKAQDHLIERLEQNIDRLDELREQTDSMAKSGLHPPQRARPDIRLGPAGRLRRHPAASSLDLCRKLLGDEF